MQSAAGNDTPEIQNHYHRAIVVDLVTLAQRIQASIKLLERAIARELPRSSFEAHDVFVLDDVTPCYARASAALLACQVGLGEALHSMQAGPAFAPDADWLARSLGQRAGST
jgi:hypothetical protein